MRQVYPLIIRHLTVAALLAGATSCRDSSDTSRGESAEISLESRTADLLDAWDARSNKVLSRCVSVDGTPEDPAFEVSANDEQTEIVTASDLDSQQIKDELDGKADITINSGSFNLAAGGAYSKAMGSDSFSLSQTIVVRVRGLSKRLKDPSRAHYTAAWQDIFKNPSFAPKYRAACGDHFIVEQKLGATFIATMKFTFKSKEDRDRIAANLNLKVSEVEIAAEFAKMASAKADNFSTSFRYAQIGGDRAQITSVIASEETTRCNFNRDLKACAAVYQKALSYAHSFGCQLSPGKTVVETQKDKAPATIDCAAIAPNATDPFKLEQRFVPLTLVALPYLGELDPQSPILSQETVHKIWQKQREIGDLFNRAYADKDLVMTITRSFAHSINPVQRAKLQVVSAKADAALELLSKALDACASGQEGSVPVTDFCDQQLQAAKVDLAKPQYQYNAADLVVTFDDFGGWCDIYAEYLALEKTPEAARWILGADEAASIAAVMRALGQDPKKVNATMCTELHYQSIMLTKLEMKGSPVTRLESIGSFHALRTLRLPNLLALDLTPIARLEALDDVDFSDSTAMIDYNVLATLPNLTTINLTNTSVRAIDRLLAMPSLQKVRVHGSLFPVAQCDSDPRIDCN